MCPFLRISRKGTEVMWDRWTWFWPLSNTAQTAAQAAQERAGGGGPRTPGIRRRCARAALPRRGGGGGRACCGPRSGVPLRRCVNNAWPHGARPAGSVGWGTGGGGGGPRSGGSSCSPSGASA